MSIFDPKFEIENNIWLYLIHFVQTSPSLITKLMMLIDFLGKNIYPIEWARLSSTSVVILAGRLQLTPKPWNESPI